MEHQDRYEGHVNSQQIGIPINFINSFGDHKISMGVYSGLIRSRFDEGYNPAYPYNGILSATDYSFDLGVGLMWNWKGFYLAGAVRHLNEPKFSGSDSRLYKHYYADAGYRLKFDKFSLYPILSLSSEDSFNELRGICYIGFWNDMVSVGAGIVSRSSILTGVTFKYKGFRFGYNLNYNTSPLSNYNQYVNEFRLSYSIK
jgi:hypothetical protein